MTAILAPLLAVAQAPAATSSIIRVVTGLTASELVDKSIDYHDPHGQWGTMVHAMRLFESRPGIPPERGGNYRITDLTFNLPESYFRLEQQRGPDRIVREVRGATCTHWLNGRQQLVQEEKEAFGLDCPRSMRMRDYYAYLWGLPMKLKDPGTLLSATVHEADFFGDTLLEVKVTYDPEVGGDTWYVYFDPDTYAMRGYRFYHDEASNDGEYILLEGEEAVGELVLPASRKWYRHADSVFLGEDRIIRNTP
ncbi:MAG: DUF6503 family protein [Saprospiraceae bacterium]|nr:DUF6503 family protein [Saprospiraceae bacterium]